MLPDYDTLLETVLDRCSNHASYFHRPDHWRRVAWIGLRLCREIAEADPRYLSTLVARRESRAQWSRGLQDQTPEWGTVWDGYEALLARCTE